MGLNLKQGDKLVRKNTVGDEREIEVLAVLDRSVATKFDYKEDVGWNTIKELEECGWQLKKTRWVPEIGKYYFFLKDNGDYELEQNLSQKEDLYRISIGNCFENREQAEAYRSELIERGNV